MITSSTSAGSRSLRVDERARACARRGRPDASPRAARCVGRAACGPRRRSPRSVMGPAYVVDAAPDSPERTVRLGSRAMRNLDRSLGDGGMPLLAQLGRVVRAVRRGMGRGHVDADRARVQPVRHRARRRLRRGPRRGDELRGQQRARVGRPGRHARRLVPDPARRADGREQLTVRGEVVQLTKQVAYVESIISNPASDEIVSRAMATFAVRRADRPST